MKKPQILILILFLLVTGVNAFGKAVSIEQAENYLDQMAEKGHFSGSVLLARNGKVLLNKGYGLANIETGTPNTPQTRFRLASITKQFTGLAILILQERGKLKTDDPICKFVENCPAAWQTITLRHLVSHTSGIKDFTSLPDSEKKKSENISPLQIIDWFKDKPLDFKPGERFSYSNSGYILLGYVIEKLSGQSYKDFIAENIFQPAGMKNSGYDSHAEIIKNRASGYSLHGENVVNADYVDMQVPFAAGALYSTTEDLYLWHKALGSEKLLSHKSLEEMFTPIKDGYGFGIVMESRNGIDFQTHSGGIQGFSTNFARFPKEDAVVIVLSNRDFAPTDFIKTQMMKFIFDDKFELPEFIEMPEGGLKNFEGLYQTNENVPFQRLYVEDKKIWLTFPGGLPMPFSPVSETKFISRYDSDISLEFEKDPEAKIRSATINAPGFQQKLNRAEIKPPALEGNFTFRLKGFEKATVVNLAGTFNNWKPTATFCGKENDGWVCRLDLTPGKYLYKFIVDGRWIVDPANPLKEDDGNGNTNSVVQIFPTKTDQ
ncbi:MAG: serine hydrolase [Pyrinomonadaceae bacterium]